MGFAPRASLGRWRKRGEQNQAIDRPRAGRTTRIVRRQGRPTHAGRFLMSLDTKIDAIAGQQGRIAGVLLTTGQASDIDGAHILLVNTPPHVDLIAGKACNADDLRAFLTRQGTRPVISPVPLATQHDKTGRNLLAGLCRVAALSSLLRLLSQHSQ